MKIKVLCFANKETGWGHWYRSIALAEYIRSQGHQVVIISDRQPPENFPHHQIPYDDQALWRSPLIDHCDWLIIDLPNEAPDWLYDACRDKGVKTLVLNGVGHQVGDRADLRIIQGLSREGGYSGPDYIILRESVFMAKAIRRPVIDWFVFGGASDKMGLTEAFPNWQRISFNISEIDWQAGDSHDNGFLIAASQCRRACVAMGMTAWELAAGMGIPTYVFSLTDLHLKFALEMDRAGYIKAWPKIGLPTRGEMVDFLSEPHQVTGMPVDGWACRRIYNLMLKKNISWEK